MILAALVVLWVNTIAPLPTAPTAEAAVHNLFPADADGFPKGHFYSDEALYVTLTSDFYVSRARRVAVGPVRCDRMHTTSSRSEPIGRGRTRSKEYS